MTRPAEYAEREPATALARHAVCAWTARSGSGGEPHGDCVLPDGCIDLIWDGERLFVAGPDTGPVAIPPRPGGWYAAVRFRPGLAPAFLRTPSSELLDARVDAGDLLGARVAPLVDRLHALSAAAERDPCAAREAARAIEAALVGWLPEAAPPDSLVEAAVAALRATAEARPVRALAARLGVSERQLHRRCVAAIGYGPKTLHRVLRFRRFLAIGAVGGARDLAALAAEAGYADQAHLARDCRELAGVPPSRLLARPWTAA